MAIGIIQESAAFTQKVEFLFPFWIPGVADAAFVVCLTSTEQGSELEPQALLAVNVDAGFGLSRPSCPSRSVPGSFHHGSA